MEGFHEKEEYSIFGEAWSYPFPSSCFVPFSSNFRATPSTVNSLDQTILESSPLVRLGMKPGPDSV
jgi:hypothetical protein